MRELESILRRIDGRGYKAYKDLERRRFRFPGFELVVDHVQGDPFAAPSRVRALVPARTAALPAGVLGSAPRRRATRDFLARAFRAAARGNRDLAIDAGAQTVLDRSACLLAGDGSVELRFTVNLPAAGRRILGRRAWELLGRDVVRAVEATTAARLDLPALERHAAVVEDQVALRDQLAAHGLVAFVADGALLPRRSGVDDRPLENGIPFAGPESLRVTLEAPNAGPVTGMGVPTGITLVVGGGFHGKSTLLRALESGVYDHVPGDGREGVVTDPSAVKIRAEDGRAVTGVDISPFISHLPYGKPTESFTTELASGSTSQAAALVEALEAGAAVLLVDEDTSATNFMIRDQRMQALVAKEKEPITPFVDRIRELRDTLGVSTILVMGGSGDYLDHADTVIQMDAYRPVDVTAAAHEIARSHPTGRREEHETELRHPRPRLLDPRSIRPERKPGRVAVKAARDHLLLGRSEIDLRAVEQLADPSQVRAIGWLLARLAGEGRAPLPPLPVLEGMLRRLEGGQWDWLTGRPDGDLARPRPAEVMAALNRLRGVRLTAAG